MSSATSSVGRPSGYSSVNEVSPDSPTAPYLVARFAGARSFADRSRTDRVCIGPVSRADRCALHFGGAGILGRGVFQL